MQSTHVGQLDLPMLRPAARQAHVVPALHNCSLLSMGTVCDAGYTISLDEHDIRIQDKGKTILSGKRRNDTGMWHIDLPMPNVQVANALGEPKISELVAFAHSALFSPALSTLEIPLAKGFITNFPGLTATNLRRHPPVSRPMDKGHLDQARKNHRSTKPAIIEPDDNHVDIDEYHPEPSNTKSHHCYAAIIEPTGQIYTDQTGRFVIPSSSGNNYLMILYDWDSNHIFAQPFKNRTAACIKQAYNITPTTLFGRPAPQTPATR
jgi:hypothetical protein